MKNWEEMRWHERLMFVLSAPFRALMALVNLTPQQMKSLLLVALLGGIVVYSMMSLHLLNRAEATIGKGADYVLQFNLIKTQLQNHFWLTAWFALVIGLVAFGADWIRAKYGDVELSFGRAEAQEIARAAAREAVREAAPLPPAETEFEAEPEIPDKENRR